MEMVLMDDNGDRIYASIKKTLIYMFEKDLKESFVYSIAFFGVASNVENFKTTKHQYKLNFLFATKVIVQEDSCVSSNPS
ncbi:hypothetical protein CR513_61086, partial [Mucuna pruriens]